MIENTAKISKKVEEKQIVDEVCDDIVAESSITETNEEETSHMDCYLTSLETGTKPWYLSCHVIYRIIEESVQMAPFSSVLMHRAVDGISSLTSFINDKTKAKIPVIDEEMTVEFLQKVNGLLSDVVIRMDDNVDWARSKLALSLRKLVTSVDAHSKMIKDVCVDKIDVATKLTNQSIGFAKTEATSKYKQAKSVLLVMLENIRARYPELFEKVDSVATSYSPAACTTYVQKSLFDAKQRAVDAGSNTTSLVLKTAQPYVHTAYSKACDGIAQATEISQPYVVHAKPYVDQYYEPYVVPLVTRAESTYEALQDNTTLGPYLKSAVEVLSSAIEATKLYCVKNADLDDHASKPVEGTQTEPVVA